jgi:choline dehydrogenase-like flavoprotein
MVEPARATGLLEVWTGMEVEQLRLDAGRVRAVVLRDRRSGEHREVTAETVLVGAGAIGTPALLLRSGVKDESDQLGRNHMCHLGAVAVGVFARPTGAALHFTKELGLTDFYLGEPDGTAGGRGGTFRHKLGYAQAIPVPGPASLRDRVPFPVPDGVARWLHAHSLLFAGSVEDLPRTENRVRLGQGGRIRLQRAYHGYDVARGRWWARRLARTLRRAGAALGLGTVASRERVHVGHQVGTCRFGRDPRHAVLDPTCRVHSVDNLYVVDGSFMPTSLGVGPALTIAANALRVAHHVFEETS